MESYVSRRKWLPTLVFVSLTALLMAWSWHQWADVLVDAGFQLHTFWQLSEGKILFRDLAYYHGPLSPYLAAAVFRVFGVSIEALALFQAGVVVLVAHLIYAILRRASDHLCALGAAVFFLLVFAFSQYTLTANYNFIMPYKFEAVHGTLFLLALIYFLVRAFDTPKPAYHLLAGFSVGLCLLTSFEIVVAALAVSLLGFAILLWRARERDESPARLLGTALAAALSAPLACALWLGESLPAREAAEKTFNAIIFPLRHPELSQNVFYRNAAGLDNVAGNLKFIGVLSFFAVLALLVLLGMERLTYSWRSGLKKTAGFIAGIAIVVLWLGWGPLPFGFLLRFLPFSSIALLAWQLAEGTRSAKRGELKTSQVALLLWALFSLVMLAKILLVPQAGHIGFYLAMPATLGFIVAFCHSLPQILERRYNAGTFLRAAGTGFFVILGFLFFHESSTCYKKKTFVVGKGADTLASWDPDIFGDGLAIGLAVKWIEENTPKTSTLLTVPEGTILNYLTRRHRPGPYTMNVLELLTHGEDTILDAWRMAPPDFVAVFHRDGGEFGYGIFGQSPNYGAKTLAWIHKNYTSVYVIASAPAADRGGIEFFKRSGSGVE